MKIAKHIDDIAFVYILGSIIIGPGLIFLISSFAPGPIGDCGDNAWFKAGMRNPIQISIIVSHYDWAIVLSEGFMFCIGAVIVGLLIVFWRRHFGWSLFGVLFMLFFYGLVIVIFSNTRC
jgi:hypothetical protein